MVTIHILITVLLIYSFFVTIAFLVIDRRIDKTYFDTLHDCREMYGKSLEKYKELILNMADSIDLLKNKIDKLEKEKNEIKD